MGTVRGRIRRVCCVTKVYRGVEEGSLWPVAVGLMDEFDHQKQIVDGGMVVVRIVWIIDFSLVQKMAMSCDRGSACLIDAI